MKPAIVSSDATAELRQPLLFERAGKLHNQLKQLSTDQIARLMSVSPALAAKTRTLIHDWDSHTSAQRSAIDSFIGDIYSGLQVPEWNQADRHYADKTLRILSGLYGILRPLDGVMPYRLEMGYRLTGKIDHRLFANLYDFWKDEVAATLPDNGPIINLAAVEYSKLVLPYVDSSRVVTPVFRTIHPKTQQPTFVVVHAKIARGAFAGWLIRQRITRLSDLSAFDDIGYRYDAAASTPLAPVFVCQTFGGLGLSLRLK